MYEVRFDPPLLLGADQSITTAVLPPSKLVVGAAGVEGAVAARIEKADEDGPSPNAFTAETLN